ncbi:uncharacterized protein LOC126629772 [Malus sylvestris]|uniref:uncharacterized protein n=1 Tax=Malus domestica TaxID=3750 RepID=UPI0007ECE19E|nr:uncharacterized protein LOC108171784 [Malus domestica]XP_050155849.1 uncharacterized protein LOC126629772 [Malus sylvestris]
MVGRPEVRVLEGVTTGVLSFRLSSKLEHLMVIVIMGKEQDVVPEVVAVETIMLGIRFMDNCPIIVEGENLEIDLIHFKLAKFDVIMGMDWLSKHRANVACWEKIVTFNRPELPATTFMGERRVLPNSIIFAIQATRLLNKGCVGFLAHVVVKNEPSLRPEEVPVVRNFIDVFPDDLPGLPPAR